jgi:hypothetical protein
MDGQTGGLRKVPNATTSNPHIIISRDPGRGGRRKKKSFFFFPLHIPSVEKTIMKRKNSPLHPMMINDDRWGRGLSTWQL